FAAYRFLAAHADRPHALAALELPATARPVVRLSLPFDAGSVATAREVVRELCRDWEVVTHLGDAELVVSELVTNAILQAVRPLRLTIALRGAYLHRAVGDGSAQVPRPRPRPGDFGPRGLGVVDLLSKAWGSTPYRDGKTVWAILRVRTVNGRRRKD